MRKIIFVVLALLFVLCIGNAQRVVDEQILYNASGQPYFQLSRSTGDSTNTLAIDVRKQVLYGGQYVTLYPDSMSLVYHLTADSIACYKIAAKSKTSPLMTTYAYTYLDSCYNSTAVIKRGTITVTPWTHYIACTKGFGVSILAATGTSTNAYTKANASKLYILLRKYYTLP
jgi:hypothetical protein